MSMTRTSMYRSPCEIIRKINDMFQGDGAKDKRVRELLSECEEKAKYMSIELTKYVPNFYNVWDKNKTANRDDEFRSRNNYKYHKL